MILNLLFEIYYSKFNIKNVFELVNNELIKFHNKNIVDINNYNNFLFIINKNVKKFR